MKVSEFIAIPWVSGRMFLAGLLAAITVACGGGGDSGAAPATAGSLVVSGLAATGAPVSNAIVSVKCVTGATVSGATTPDGTFNLTLQAGQTLPCMVKVTRGNPDVTLYSLATGAGYVNVTPLTDMVLAQALGVDPTAAFVAFDQASASRAEMALPGAKTYVAAQIAALLGRSPQADVLSGRFRIGDADDQLLDSLGQKMSAARKTMDDVRQIATKGGDLNALLQVTAVPGGAEGGPEQERGEDDDEYDDDGEEESAT